MRPKGKRPKKKKVARRKPASTCAPAPVKKRKPKGSKAARARARARAKVAAKQPKHCTPAKRKKRKRVSPKVPANPAVSAKRPLPAPGALTLAVTPAPPAPIGTPAAPPAPAPPPAPTPTLPSSERFGAAEAERLLWRAGFGPRPGDVERYVAMGLDAAVDELVHPVGAARLVGPAPTDDEGAALQPEKTWGHGHCWWLDRMVRSDQPLVERMTLVWHDWFATSDAKVGRKRLMLDQNETFRRNALGSFPTLLSEATRDPAMLVWLDGIASTKSSPSENHARELMELFTLGTGRGAYSEGDVRELARVMTGWRADWVQGTGWTNFRYETARHDAASKTVFGRTGAWDYDDATRLCVEHPAHPRFLVAKLWGSFVGAPLDVETGAALEAAYVNGGMEIAPVLARILRHPAFYAGAALAKPPAVYTAGLLRMLGQGLDTDDWAWLCLQAGQLLFEPPNVAGWDDDAWLSTSTWRARWNLVVWATHDLALNPWGGEPYDATETPEAAVARVLAWAGQPATTQEQRDALLAFARDSVAGFTASWQQGPYRAQRQNALRLLLLTAADWHLA